MGPADLTDLLAPLLAADAPSDAVLVGPGTADDAGVYALGDEAIVGTADFITPMCDDPRRFGRVAAANALSDVYAMGGSVLFALNLCCFPEDKSPEGVLTEILEGGLEKIREAGGALLGGHSVRDAELKYGLAVVGRADPGRLLTNAGARAGQHLVLSKPLGTGAIINGFRDGRLDEAGLEPALCGMERLNDVAARLALAHGVTGCTDVSGYGLAGHALEMGRASNVTLTLTTAALPVYEGFRQMCDLGVSTRGARENAAAVADAVEVPRDLALPKEQLLYDPQTSGGLLMSVDEAGADALVAELAASGHEAALIGTVAEGPSVLLIA